METESRIYKAVGIKKLVGGPYSVHGDQIDEAWSWRHTPWAYQPQRPSWDSYSFLGKELFLFWEKLRLNDRGRRMNAVNTLA